MKLNQLPNFRVEDFESERAWIGRLFTQLNPFVQAVAQVFEKNIDFSTNIKSLTRSYTLNVVQFQAFNFQWPFLDQQPGDLKVTQALKGTLLTPTILLAAWSYDATNSLIQVMRMVEVTDSGISAMSGRYQFSIRVNV
jgi:hypothetical protein